MTPAIWPNYELVNGVWQPTWPLLSGVRVPKSQYAMLSNHLLWNRPWSRKEMQHRLADPMWQFERRVREMREKMVEELAAGTYQFRWEATT